MCMRKVSKQTAYAFKCKRPLKVGNSKVEYLEAMGQVEYYLHGNRIAKLRNGVLELTNCGWNTVTTKERLNSILTMMELPYRIYQKNFEWFIGGNGECYLWDSYNYFNIETKGVAEI